METIWAFFCDPKNLGAITPAYMNFRITSPPYKGELFEGQIISYKISPLLGISMRWVTEITRVEKHKCFTDEQQKGPYKLWQHTHSFTKTAGGILMSDEVRYELPLGVLGNMVHTLFIKRQVESIFDYRHQQIETVFNKTV